MLTAQEIIALYDQLVPIVTNESLTKEERGNRLLPIMIEITALCEGDFEIASNVWNNTMAAIVEHFNLRRH